MAPGMLYVTMEPHAGLSSDQFHEWYNNEHGPTRLRMPDIFTTGTRYRATDGQKPSFLAAYDVTDMTLLTTKRYTDLRANRSPREAATIAQIDVDRSFFDLLATHTAPNFVPLDQVRDSDKTAAGRVLVFVEVKATDAPGAEDALVEWYDKEHFPMLSKVPGWLRSRCYRPSSIEAPSPQKAKTILTLHEYAPANGLGGAEHKASMDTPWRTNVFANYVASKGRRTYEAFYVFGPASRDLSSLAGLPASTATFTAADGKTETTSGPDTAVIRSYATTPDGLDIPYQLEGNTAADAPIIAFSNSLLTSLHMWDAVVALVKQHKPQFRILRYDTRGRHELPSPPQRATMEMLADDLGHLLTALRIPKLHALIGVSLGGATTLQFAIKYPDRTAKFVACDCNIAGSPANTKAWQDRIVLAEGDSTGMQQLADVTVSRWFDEGTETRRPGATKQMVDIAAANSLEGFKYSCQALWDFDLKQKAPSCKVPGLLIVGENDGKGALAKAMDGFKGLVGPNGTSLKVVPNAGHLPMFENPDAFWDAIKDFL